MVPGADVLVVPVMNLFLILLIIAAALVLLVNLLLHYLRKPVDVQPLPQEWRKLLEKDVPFYIKLDAGKRKLFEERMMHFLATTRITGVNTEADDTDRVYIAASAIIPIFGFNNWEYINLTEILLYPNSFSHDFDQTGDERSVLGMVGDGALNNTMILSRHEVRQAFLNKTSKSNTAIHEFVHLVDKTDGAVDGVPEFFLDKEYVLPWLRQMQENIQQILRNRSDINPYGATNEAEFLAVAAEYFFERPDLLQSKHPELYALLSTMFRQNITGSASTSRKA